MNKYRQKENITLFQADLDGDKNLELLFIPFSKEFILTLLSDGTMMRVTLSKNDMSVILRFAKDMLTPAIYETSENAPSS